jgi:hypothetical protein
MYVLCDRCAGWFTTPDNRTDGVRCVYCDASVDLVGDDAPTNPYHPTRLPTLLAAAVAEADNDPDDDDSTTHVRPG